MGKHKHHRPESSQEHPETVTRNVRTAAPAGNGRNTHHEIRRNGTASGSFHPSKSAGSESSCGLGKKDQAEGHGKYSKNRTTHLDIRLTPEEKAAIEKKATACGLSCSEYAREVILGHNPKNHLTDNETAALKELQRALRHLTNVDNALKGHAKEEKKRIFHNDAFMEDWIKGTWLLKMEWNDIRKRFYT